MSESARAWHGLTAVVAGAALAIQLALVVDGASVLVTDDPPELGTRVFRYFCYFTIQSNILVAVGTAWLVLRPDANSLTFRALRVASIVGITITALVHFVLLRPLLDLQGWSRVVDIGLHQVVPVLAVAGWLAFGPRPRVDRRAIATAFAWPLAWLAFTLVAGQISGWVPYPFVDHEENGWVGVAAVCLGVLVLTVGLFGGARWLDRRLAPAPRLESTA